MEKTIHLGITDKDLKGNGKFGRYILMPGSPERARTIASMFNQITKEIDDNPRGLNSYFGNYCGIAVAAITSGMTPGSLEITADEVFQCKGTRILRVGTSGTLQPNVGSGDFVISTGAVRDDGASNDYLPLEVPAICHLDWVMASHQAAGVLGIRERTFEGITHSKKTLRGREGGAKCPMQAKNLEFKKMLTESMVINSEMELATLCALAQCNQQILSLKDGLEQSYKIIKVGGLCVVVNNFPKEKKSGEEEELFSATPEEQKEMEETLCKFALESVKMLSMFEAKFST